MGRFIGVVMLALGVLTIGINESVEAQESSVRACSKEETRYLSRVYRQFTTIWNRNLDKNYAKLQNAIAKRWRDKNKWEEKKEQALFRLQFLLAARYEQRGDQAFAVNKRKIEIAQNERFNLTCQAFELRTIFLDTAATCQLGVPLPSDIVNPRLRREVPTQAQCVIPAA